MEQEKEFVTIIIEALKWTDGAVEIDKAISDLNAAKAKGATHIEVETWTEYDCATDEIDAVQKRFETDEEAKQRVAHERRVNEFSKRQKAMYDQLEAATARFEKADKALQYFCAAVKKSGFVDAINKKQK